MSCTDAHRAMSPPSRRFLSDSSPGRGTSISQSRNCGSGGMAKRGIGTALVEMFNLEARAAGALEVWVLNNRSNRAAGACTPWTVGQNRDNVM